MPVQGGLAADGSITGAELRSVIVPRIHPAQHRNGWTVYAVSGQPNGDWIMSKGYAVVLAIMMALVGNVSALPGSGAEPPRPGVCSDAFYHNMRVAWLDPPVGAFCGPLRLGLEAFHARRFDDALAEFTKADHAAAGLPTAADRRAAAAEALAARALAVEALGEAGRALVVMAEAEATGDASVLLAAGAMLARHGLFDAAAQRFARSRATLPRFWCSADDQVLARLQAGHPPRVESDPVRDITRWHHLPSTLHPVAILGCGARKAQRVPFPLPRSFHLHFGLNQTHWAETAENRAVLARMVAVMRRPNKTPALTFRLEGHSDQSCPPRGQNCRAFNHRLALARAESVAALLRAALPPDTVLTVASRGMEAPLVDRGVGQADSRNRRVTLTVDPAVPRQTAAACPWRVDVYDPVLPPQYRAGVASVPAISIQPHGPAVSVSRRAVYVIRHVPSASALRHIYAFSRTDGTAYADLFAAAGPPLRTADDLAEAGGSLPLPAPDGTRLAFAVSPEATTEVIELYAANRPVATLEAPRRLPPFVAIDPATPPAETGHPAAAAVALPARDPGPRFQLVATRAIGRTAPGQPLDILDLVRLDRSKAFGSAVRRNFLTPQGRLPGAFLTPPEQDPSGATGPIAGLAAGTDDPTKPNTATGDTGPMISAAEDSDAAEPPRTRRTTQVDGTIPPLPSRKPLIPQQNAVSPALERQPLTLQSCHFRLAFL